MDGTYLFSPPATKLNRESGPGPCGDDGERVYCNLVSATLTFPDPRCLCSRRRAAHPRAGTRGRFVRSESYPQTQQGRAPPFPVRWLTRRMESTKPGPGLADSWAGRSQPVGKSILSMHGDLNHVYHCRSLFGVTQHPMIRRFSREGRISASCARREATDGRAPAF